MIAAISRLLADKDKIYNWIGRSGCAACDRNEAAYQLARLNSKIANESDKLSLFSADF